MKVLNAHELVEIQLCACIHGFKFLSIICIDLIEVFGHEEPHNLIDKIG